ncbi:ABC transporter substrate-binding protein [Kitasatospora sp. NPDC101183]|uniref:ABC transporter substrate-binding protein n=1 Tax=Kitasatospora sp. NPDC101183 TaxID=3364100 RepID=UPI0038073231
MPITVPQSASDDIRLPGAGRARPRRRARALGAVALAAAVLVATAACGSSGSGSGGQAGAAEGSAPVDGGTLRFAAEVEPDCLDPAVSPADVTGVVDRNVFDSLVRLDDAGTFHPWLAKSWQVSPDGLTYTFHLRTDVLFHDGTKLDAAAVKASLEHAVAPATKSLYAGGLLEGFAGADAPDPATAVIRLSKPRAALLQALSTPYLGIQSPKSLADNAADLCRKPVGSGPFSFESWEKSTSVTLKRNPAYAWGPEGAAHTGAAHLDKLVFQIVPEDSVRQGQLRSGQIEIAGNAAPARIADLKTAKGFQVLQQAAPGQVYALFLNPVSGVLSDERVRSAFARSIQIDALVKSVYHDTRHRAQGPLGPGTVYYNKAVEGVIGYDPAAAGKLLDDAGWTGRDADGYRTKDGKRLTLVWPTSAYLSRDSRDLLAQGVQADAKKVGIELQYVNQDPGTFAKTAMGGGANVLGFSFVRPEADILRHYFGSASTAEKGGSNLFRISDPQLDGWLDQGATSSDPAVRGQAYGQAQKYVVDHVLEVPLYVPVTALGASSRVRGVDFDAIAFPLFYDAWLAAR